MRCRRFSRQSTLDRSSKMRWLRMNNDICLIRAIHTTRDQHMERITIGPMLIR
jgi:hypothetical protein